MSCQEENDEEYESMAEGDQIAEQSYETESQFEQQEISIHDKLKQVKEAFNSIKSSIHRA